MNKKLQDFARNEIKDGLLKLPEEWQMNFKHMYSHKNLDLSLDEIVDNMSEDNLNIVMNQVERSVDKIIKIIGKKLIKELSDKERKEI